MSLSTSQIQHFHNHRYLVLPNFLSRDTMDRVKEWTEQVVAWPEEPGRHMVYYEDDLRHQGRRVLCRIENFVPFHEGFHELINGAERLSQISQLLGEPAVLFKEKINFKLPGGDGFKWHQDVQAGWDAYGSIHLTLMISIDESTPENGCLQIAHGYQGRELLGPSWAPLEEQALQNFEIRDCPTQPGDAIFFDSYIPHGSQANQTDQSRRILYLTYGLASEGDHREKYYEEKRRSYPPDVERESGKEYTFKV